MGLKSEKQSQQAKQSDKRKEQIGEYFSRYITFLKTDMAVPGVETVLPLTKYRPVL